MKKLLVLLFLGSFSIQLSAMGDGNEGGPLKKQKTHQSDNETTPNELDSKENKEELEILEQNALSIQKKEWQNYLKQNRDDRYDNDSYGESNTKNKNELPEEHYLFDYDSRLPNGVGDKEVQLKFAVLNNYIELAKDALEQGAYPNITIDIFAASEEIAINRETINWASTYTEADGDKVHFTLLSYTIINNQKEMFYLLLNCKSIDVNYIPDDRDNKTYRLEDSNDQVFKNIGSIIEPSFYQAAYFLQLDMLNSLIKAGATIKYCGDKKHTTLIKILKNYISFPKSKFQAFKECTKILINNGFDINAQDEDGFTVLMEAINLRNLFLVEFLVNEFNPTINIKNHKGDTALDLAKHKLASCSGSQTNFVKIVNFLEKANKKTKDFKQKLIINEIMEATPFPKVLAEMISEYLEDNIKITGVL